MTIIRFGLFVLALSAALTVGLRVAIGWHPITLLAERIEEIRP